MDETMADIEIPGLEQVRFRDGVDRDVIMPLDPINVNS